MKEKLLVLGGAGFIGSHIVSQAIKEGFEVSILEIRQPQESDLIKGAKILVKDVGVLTDDELVKLLKGYDYAIFAAGADDRVIPKKPAYDFFKKSNIDSSVKFLKNSKKAGVKKSVVLNSYFSYFDRVMPKMNLAKFHPYIKSRVEQRQACLAVANDEFKVIVLELPYIFGVSPGKKPLWAPLIKYVNSWPILFFMKGGTAMVSASNVAKAAINSLKYSKESLAIPVYTENIEWTDWINRILEYSGKKPKPIIFVPKILAKTGMFFLKLVHTLKGLEGGLDPVKYVDFQYINSFITDDSCSSILKIKKESINESLKETVKECLK